MNCLPFEKEMKFILVVHYFLFEIKELLGYEENGIAESIFFL